MPFMILENCKSIITKIIVLKFLSKEGLPSEKKSFLGLTSGKEIIKSIFGQRQPRLLPNRR